MKFAMLTFLYSFVVEAILDHRSDFEDVRLLCPFEASFTCIDIVNL